MICPVCQTDNIAGSDECENCGADLRATGLPAGAGGDVGAVLLSEHLADLQPRRPVSVGPDDEVAAAVALMQQHRIGCVTVEADRLVGILTERDLVLKLGGRSLAGVRVSEVMTPDPVVLRGDDTIAVAIHKMALGGFRHIPLVSGGRATGIISARDLSHHLVTLIG
ncbi:MAG: cyclic nucleotide-binding/CBS domain-containing protein [Candidatus Limnocylindrales bacterium]